MNNQAPRDNDKDDGEDGESERGGDFGKPELKPNLEALFDPASVIREGHGLGTEHDPKTAYGGVETYGSWEYHEKALMLFHKNLKKRLMLEQLNAPSKMMRVVAALATQTQHSGQWDIDNLLKAMDAASHRRFGKGLYQISCLSSDNASLDWRNGTLTPNEHPKWQSGVP